MSRLANPDTSKRFVGFFIDADLFAALAAKAKRREQTVSAAIRKLIRDDLGV